MVYKIDRRDFLLSGVAAGLIGVAAGTSDTRATKAPVPRSGGVLTGKLSGDPSSFDVVSSTSSLTLSVIAPCYNSLVMFDSEAPDRVIGDLARNWREENGGRRYVFNLIETARFHDGVSLTSEDVKYSFDIMRAPPEGKTSARKDLLEVIEAVSTPTEHTVVFDLKRASPSFLSTLAIGWMLVMPKHVMEARGNDLKETVIGSGPFRLKNYTRGVGVELVRNESYHQPGRPYLDAIKLFVVPDPATVYANFTAGRLFFWDNIEGSDARRIQSELGDAVVVQKAIGLSTEGISINTKKSPWSDKRLRQAVSLALSREEAVRVILGGDGVVGGLMPPGQWALSDQELLTVPGYGRDTEANRAEARRLLAEAGFPQGLSATITARKAGIHEARAVFVQDQLSRIGVKTRIDLQESAAYFDNVEARNFELLTDGLGAGINDPDAFFGDFHTCHGTRNQSAACDPAVDEIYNEQRLLADPGSRREQVKRMELAALNQFGWIGLYWKTRFLGMSSKVHGMVLHPQPDNARRLQDVWLSEA
ncbi:ABC transporter substrate-binding protein [Ensifer sp. YR511]|uniref:ABC transporter substrate-binding protein n=1 Tax=Ensifer sp. YR511 TaxID=1855294 RepID=UPI000885F094|nr:ABC transporter substrate-binding protein [Ensifer sp. YR511]SDN73140.1 peptide/nickel transport system substrate-binding protein [Ensifer sp. YR511]